MTVLKNTVRSVVSSVVSNSVQLAAMLNYNLIIESLGYQARVIGVVDDNVYITTGDYYQKSTDNGETLATVSRVFANDLYWTVHSGFISRTGVIVLVAANDVNYALITSLDNGATWNYASALLLGYGLSHSFCDDSSGNLYFGEYVGGELTSETCSVLKSTNGGLTFAPVYTFTGGEVRHIHTVRNDPYTDYIWVGSGDGGTENKLGYSTDGGTTFTFLDASNIDGWLLKQVLRTVSLIFTEDYIHWASDYDPAYFYRYDRTTGIIEELTPFSIGPGYYGTKWPKLGIEKDIMVYGMHSDTKATWYLSENEKNWRIVAQWDNISVGEMSRINALTQMNRWGYVFGMVTNVYYPDGTELTGNDVVRMSISKSSIPKAEISGISTETITESTGTPTSTIDPHGYDTIWSVEYGLTTAYGTTVYGGTITESAAVSKELTGLTPYQTYHYRIVAKTSGGTTYSADQTFRCLEPVEMFSNNFIWVDDQTGITKDESNRVAEWTDKVDEIVKFTQAVDDKKPIDTGAGISCDGIDDLMTTGALDMNQPITAYLVLKHLSITTLDTIFCGVAGTANGYLYQNGTDGKVALNAGVQLSGTTALAANTLAILRVHINSTTSSLQTNEVAPKTGNAGTNNMGGVVLASRGTDRFANELYREVAFRGDDDAPTEAKIFAYLKLKYGL